MPNQETKLDVKMIDGMDSARGYAVRDAVAELLGGRRFFLVVAPEKPGESGDCYANMASQRDSIALLEAVLAGLRAYRFTQGQAVELRAR